jgi:hypothetical protein
MMGKSMGCRKDKDEAVSNGGEIGMMWMVIKGGGGDRW